MYARLEVAALTDVGCVRRNNEDSFSYDEELGIYVVCDGMGGMAAGEVASAIACDIVIGSFKSQPPEAPAAARLEAAIVAANDAVRLASTEGNQHGMGTTLVAAVLEGETLVVGNVGDSRAYLYRGGRWAQLTVDHSYVNELVRQGQVRIEDVGRVDLKGLESVITRAIGASSEVEPDFFTVALEEGDTLLLASDGLTRYAGDAAFGSLIDTTDLNVSCARLIQAAKDAGGADNITCLLLRYSCGKS
jgi:protein phosphatase